MAKTATKRPRKPKVVLEKCTICKGDPTRVPFELPDFTGERCGDPNCFIVLDFKKK
jgi:hypothetical protein